LTEEKDQEVDVPGKDAAGVGASEKAPWIPGDWVQLLLEMVKSPSLKQEVAAFVASTQEKNAAEASEDVEAFLSSGELGWANRCPDLDKIWDKFVPRLAATGLCEPSVLVKPSGPLLALLCVVWRYPTNTTKHPLFGVVFDRTNGCINMQ